MKAYDLSQGPRPNQLQVEQAHVTGTLDLRFAQLDYPVTFIDCTFEHPVDLREAEFRSVSFERCKIPGIRGDHIVVRGDVRIDDAEIAGQLSVVGARISGSLHLTRTTINPGSENGDAALNIASAEIGGDLLAEEMRVRGTVEASGARIKGTVSMPGARLIAPGGGLALNGPGMKIGGDLRAERSAVVGSLSLRDLQALRVVLNRVTIDAVEFPALDLTMMRCGASILVADASISGSVIAKAAEIGGGAYLSGSRIAVAADASSVGRAAAKAVDFRDARIAGHLRCAPSFASSGEFDMADARVGGSVDFSGAFLGDAAGSPQPLTIDRCTVGGDLRCADLHVRGESISIEHARIGGEASITSPDGTAPYLLAACGLRVAENLSVNTPGIVVLRGTEVGGDTRIFLSRLAASDDGSAVADLSMVHCQALIVRGIHRSGLVDLSDASVALYNDDPEHQDPSRPIVLKDFEYRAIASSSLTAIRYRLDWLAAGTRVERATNEAGYTSVRFISQPYRQLAAAYQSDGDERAARTVLYRMSAEYNRRAVSSRNVLAKVWNWIQDLLWGYGYRMARPLLWILVTVAGAAIWFHVQYPQVGVAEVGVRTIGTMFPGTGFDRWSWEELPPAGYVVAGGATLIGLFLGAIMIAVFARTFRR